METFKEFKRMNDQEKKDYIQSFSQFTDEGYKELVACQNGWNESCLKSFKQALNFLTAFSKFKPFVHDAEHFKDYKRRLNSVIMYLDMIRKETGLNKVATVQADDKKEYIAGFQPTHADPADTAAATGAAQTTASTQEEIKAEVVNQHVPLPSDHISAYKHLLSPALQAEVENIAALRGQIALHAEMAKRYTESKAPQEAIKSEAEQAVALQKTLGDLYEAIDVELVEIKAQGENITLPQALEAAAANRAIEIAKNTALAAPAAEATATAQTETIAQTPADQVAAEQNLLAEAKTEVQKIAEPAPSNTNLTKAEIDELPEGEEKELLKKLRIESNKRYLVRKDVKLTPKREAEIALRTAELEAWGITLAK